MIVVDASAAIAIILGRESGTTISSRVFAPLSELATAPALIDVEVAHSLRRLARDQELSAAEATDALELYRQLPIRTMDHRFLLERIWSLRHQVSAYDAAYLSLAEALDATLVTCDRRLANAHGHTARVEVYA